MATAQTHPMAPQHLPGYIATADGSDPLFVFMVVFTVGLVVLIGVLYLTLHSVPERMAHQANHSQLQVIGILALAALFTHNNLFWIAAILVAAFRVPDFITPLVRIADSLTAMARQTGAPGPAPVSDPAPPPEAAAGDPAGPDTATGGR